MPFRLKIYLIQEFALMLLLLFWVSSALSGPVLRSARGAECALTSSLSEEQRSKGVNMPLKSQETVVMHLPACCDWPVD